MDIFQFKHFQIKQNSASVFKVNTEAVLLTAWSNIEKVRQILEIGSGTGLISIGLNQRFDNLPKTTAIDINENAFRLTLENIELNSISNIQAIWMDIKEFTQNSSQKYDLIVSNPPYFDTPLKSLKERDQTAKYTDSLNYDELVKSASAILNSEGIFSVIIPFSDLDEFQKILLKFKMYTNRICNVLTIPQKKPLRVMIESSFQKSAISTEVLTIKENGVYTEEYKILTKDYYTIF